MYNACTWNGDTCMFESKKNIEPYQYNKVTTIQAKKEMVNKANTGYIFSMLYLAYSYQINKNKGYHAHIFPLK